MEYTVSMVLSQVAKRMITNRRKPVRWDRLKEGRAMSYRIVLKIWAAIMTALIIFDILLFLSLAAGAQETVEVPQEVAGISQELGQQYGICPETIQAICWVESRFSPDAENDGCLGIMQVSERWHRDRMERLGVTDLTDTEGCMRVAVDYLSELVEDGEDMERALMRYHGESRIMERLSEGELSAYVDQVLAVSAMLERRNGK